MVPVTTPARDPIEARLARAGLPPLPRLAWLELDLDALVANLGSLRALGGGVPVHPVVKADAYGHGALPITRALEAAGADGFCVATLDEAIALRAGRIRAPIRVLYPIPIVHAAEAARRRIDVAAGDPVLVGALIDRAVADGVGRAGRRRLGIELEVETGLGRGGVLPDALLATARAIESSPATRLVGLWTHLQASEDATTTAHQMARFATAAADLRAAGIRLPARHVAASGGLLTDVAALDGARPGLSVYGIVPDELEGIARARGGVRLRPVMSLHARPVRVAELPPGHGIGYGPSFTTQRPSRIVTLPLGYGDGVARALANRAEALVRGVRVPLVGNVSMDGVMADVTDVPGGPVGYDDEFVLLGVQGTERITAEDLARLRTTNTWEVVTQMSGRLPRVYHAAAEVKGLRTLVGWRG